MSNYKINIINTHLYYTLKSIIELNYSSSDLYISNVRQLMFKSGYTEAYYMLFPNSYKGYLLSTTTFSELFNILLNIKRMIPYERHINN